MNDDQNSSNQELIQNLLLRIEKLEQKFEELAEGQFVYNNITVQTVHDLHIHEPVLKELNYQLDSIDIKEMSGTLTIGNHFMRNVEQRTPKKKQGSSKQANSESVEKGNGIQILIDGKPAKIKEGGEKN
jgi:pyruvate/oxaloacetate carboxyltransferase